jgi:hypothetical protein
LQQTNSKTKTSRKGRESGANIYQVHNTNKKKAVICHSSKSNSGQKALHETKKAILY